MSSWGALGSGAVIWSACRSPAPTEIRSCSTTPTGSTSGVANARLNLAFAQGPHFCLGAQLARTETTIAVGRLLDGLTRLRLDPDYPNAPQGLVFRKPPTLRVRWTV